ncbi:MAG TPA: 2-dehydropantoate 2-reductase [Trebonia sp.]|nr:2-dehydropantoate 2-reductase [Trebonia sp.]
MRILVIGAGATGGYFGARLAQAGRDVTFLLRPRRAAAVRAGGIRLTGQGPDEMVPATVLTAGEIDGPYDLVLLTVKNGALDSAMDDLAPAVGPGTLIVPFLNGMSHLDRLSQRFGVGAVLGGVVIVATTVNANGDIVRLAPQASLTTGAQPGSSVDTAGVAAALDGVIGFDFALSADILADMWGKWVFIATLGALTCLMRGAVGEIVAQPGGDKLGPAFLAEAAAIAAANGYPVADAQVRNTTATVTQPGSGLTSSMYRDVIDGRPTESDYIIGDLVTRGRSHGIESPLFHLAATQLAVHNARAGA